MWVRFWVIC
ncbi:hypothetical protein F383_24093 [Gossypium arboreum]|uniref:Uncharacterized protein n=1 Tax=Gossypium arboreum TaxID=29729 RepID=A0A0B0PAI8_GOSAR|nr:hypothetical protein F383_24093 [Gossypium arboreum]